MHPWTRSLSLLVSLLFGCLMAVPSYALTTYSNVSPCGDELCVYFEWSGSIITSEPYGEIDLGYSIPAGWHLTGGTIEADGGQVWVAVRYANTGEDFFASSLLSELHVLGSNGELLARSFSPWLIVYCWGSETTSDTVLCSDNYVLVGFQYTATAGDPAFSGPLKLAWNFDEEWMGDPLGHVDWPGEPLSVHYEQRTSGRAFLTYSPVPEPSTGLLLGLGLLGLAYRQRLHVR